MCVEVTVCNISVVLWDTVYTRHDVTAVHSDWPLVHFRSRESHYMRVNTGRAFCETYEHGGEHVRPGLTDVWLSQVDVCRANNNNNNNNKKHLKNVGPIRHCEPPHAACSNFTLPFTRCRYCRHHYQDELKPAITIAQAACDSCKIDVHNDNNNDNNDNAWQRGPL